MIQKTEVGDQTQYLTRKFNDSTIRFILKYPCLLDGHLLSQAAQILVQRLTILHSSFHADLLGTRWITRKDYETDSLTVIEEIQGDVMDAAREAALHSIDYAGETQIRCYLFQNGSESALVFLVGHMCADGRDAAYLMKKLVEIYNSLLAGNSGQEVELKSGSRSVKQCRREDFEIFRHEFHKAQSGHRAAIKSEWHFATEGEGEPCLVQCLIPKETISSCRRLTEGSSVNDVILAAYYRAYARQMALSEKTPVSIASMMDLRKYIPEGDSQGVANLSGPLNTSLPQGVGPDFSHTLRHVTQQTLALKDDKTAGLGMILAMDKLFKITLFPVLIPLSEILYSSLSIGLTNLGNVKGDELKIGELAAERMLFAGPLKKKPALQVSASGLNGDVSLCIVSQCTREDQLQLEELLRGISDEIHGAAGAG
ncbi:MAG: hypothetical protein HFI96_02925 [Lachnospiraceae bacterium]|nr:hypothetical protein [Lachnospiraceae bacterium]